MMSLLEGPDPSRIIPEGLTLPHWDLVFSVVVILLMIGLILDVVFFLYFMNWWFTHSLWIVILLSVELSFLLNKFFFLSEEFSHLLKEYLFWVSKCCAKIMWNWRCSCYSKQETNAAPKSCGIRGVVAIPNRKQVGQWLSGKMLRFKKLLWSLQLGFT
jgi:hypothetical protein